MLDFFNYLYSFFDYLSLLVEYAFGMFPSYISAPLYFILFLIILVCGVKIIAKILDAIPFA